MRENIITQYFEEVETTKEYNGYFCSVAEAITIVILGSICGLKNISQIHQWADISWLAGREEWEGMKCIGAVHTEFEEKGKKSREWHYYQQGTDSGETAASCQNGMEY